MAQNLDLTQFFTRDQIRKLLGQKTHSEPLTDGNGNFIFADVVSSSCRKQHAARGRGRTARLDPALNPLHLMPLFFAWPSTVRLRAARGGGTYVFPTSIDTFCALRTLLGPGEAYRHAAA